MIKAVDLAGILLKAPDAEVRFWIGKDTEAEFDTIYDDVTDDEQPDRTFVAHGVNIINIDLEPLDFDEDDEVEELQGARSAAAGYGGGGYDDYADEETPDWGEM